MKKIIFIVIFLITKFPCCFAYEEFYDLEGNSYSYEEFISYPKTILFLWISSCYRCTTELRYLNNVFTNCENNEIKFFFVNLGEKEKWVKDLIKRMHLNKCIAKNVILDKNASLAYKFRIIGMPVFLFFKNGKMIYKSSYLSNRLIKEVFKE